MQPPHYLVAGLGKTGFSIATYLKRRKLSFTLFDTRKQVATVDEFKKMFPDANLYLEHLPTAVYQTLSAVIASPGISLNEPFVLEAQRLHIPVYGDIECLARELKVPVIAITGTNGKSTVTSLVSAMATAAGLKAAVAGNIGLPVLDLLDDGQHYDLWIVELSSFQLDITFSLAPIAAVILNITPDHLDRHVTIAAYIRAKQRIYQQAKTRVYNRDDLQTLPTSVSTHKITKVSFGLNRAEGTDWGIINTEGRDFLAQGNRLIMAVDEIKLKGKHNWQNALAACALAVAAGIEIKPILSALKSFPGLPHRCQLIRTIAGVEWVNDSKGTNIDATNAAITGLGSAIQGKIILIAGGLGKGANFTELCPAIANYVQIVILIGADAKTIAQALGNLVPIFFASSLAEAVIIAQAQAQAQALANDVVLLSPACASQDMFRDFNHRGEEFIRLVKAL